MSSALTFYNTIHHFITLESQNLNCTWGTMSSFIRVKWQNLRCRVYELILGAVAHYAKTYKHTTWIFKLWSTGKPKIHEYVNKDPQQDTTVHMYINKQTRDSNLIITQPWGKTVSWWKHTERERWHRYHDVLSSGVNPSPHTHMNTRERLWQSHTHMQCTTWKLPLDIKCNNIREI